MMYLLLKSKRAKDSYDSQRIILKKIKSVIESSRPKFSGYRQQVIQNGRRINKPLATLANTRLGGAATYSSFSHTG